MESATRATTSSRKYLNGLAKCIEQSGLDSRDLTSWKLAKEKGERLFKVQFGGSYEVFEQRPIRNHIISYCVGDVQHLPKLRSRYYSRTSRWRDLVGRESKKRVEESQKPEYQPHGPERTLAPWSEDQNKSLDAWITSRLLQTFSMTTMVGMTRRNMRRNVSLMMTGPPAIVISSMIAATTCIIPTEICRLVTINRHLGLVLSDRCVDGACNETLCMYSYKWSCLRYHRAQT